MDDNFIYFVNAGRFDHLKGCLDLGLPVGNLLCIFVLDTSGAEVALSPFGADEDDAAPRVAGRVDISLQSDPFEVIP